MNLFGPCANNFFTQINLATCLMRDLNFLVFSLFFQFLSFCLFYRDQTTGGRLGMTLTSTAKPWQDPVPPGPRDSLLSLFFFSLSLSRPPRCFVSGDRSGSSWSLPSSFFHFCVTISAFLPALGSDLRRARWLLRWFTSSTSTHSSSRTSYSSESDFAGRA